MQPPTKQEWVTAQNAVIALRDRMKAIALAEGRPFSDSEECHALLVEAQNNLREAANLGLGMLL